jgi:hypothetical protein
MEATKWLKPPVKRCHRAAGTAIATANAGALSATSAYRT